MLGMNLFVIVGRLDLVSERQSLFCVSNLLHVDFIIDNVHLHSDSLKISIPF